MQMNLRMQTKTETSIEILRAMCPDEGYDTKFSGGKDSAVIAHLCAMADVRHELKYNHTTLDPPELIYHIRRYYPQVITEMPRETAWRLIARKKMPPTRRARYCCDVLKERKASPGRLIVTGIRWAESNGRRNRSMFEKWRGKNAFGTDDIDVASAALEGCISSGKTHILNPIITWTDADVWEFIKAHDIPTCSLYAEGFNRIGCIGCPMTSPAKRMREFARWPHYKASYIRAFDRMLKNFDPDETTKWFTGQDVFDWWMSQ